MNNILITGGAGFIGSNLTKSLIKKGYVVTVLDNLSKQIHGENQNSELYQSIKNISTFILGDVRKKEDWEKAINGQDAIIHLAAKTGSGQSMYEIENYSAVNILGTSYLLDILANKNHSIKKVLLASSRAVYGEGKYKCKNHGIVFPDKREHEDLKEDRFNPICIKCKKELESVATDEGARIQPTSIYGITKQLQEQMVMLMGKSLNIPTVALRYQNVYGPGQSLSNPYTGILSIFSTRILNGNNVYVYEDGLESRDFVYIDDVVEATVLALEKNQANYEVFNVGSGVATTVNEIAKTLKKLYNSDIGILVDGKYRAGDIRHNFADLNKINRVLGFNSKYKISKGILNFVDWVKTQEIQKDNYEKSVLELRNKGLIK